MKIIFAISRWLFIITGSLLVVAIMAVATMGNEKEFINFRMGSALILTMVVTFITAPLYWLLKNKNEEPMFKNQAKINFGWVWLISGLILFSWFTPIVLNFLQTK